jgi:type IV secretory pathway VirJ component
VGLAGGDRGDDPPDLRRLAIGDRVPNERTELVILAAVMLAASTAATVGEQVDLPGFGTVSVYRPEPIGNARGVVLFVSGDGGWNLGVVDMARRLAPRAIVAGLSMSAWQKRIESQPSHCWYPAGELESAAQALEKRYRLPRYVPPILVGYSSGATVVYGALAQAPDTTFAGAVSLGFCPDLEVARPVCGAGDWHPSYDAVKHRGWVPERRDLVPPWYVLQGAIDQVCTPSATAAFARAIPSAHLVWLEKVGHGFGVPSRWGKALDDAVAAMLESESLFEKPMKVAGAPFDALELPLEVTWPEGAREALVFVSGDGGWSALDKTVASELAADGIAVVGWNALRYFWSAKTPERFRADLERLVGSFPNEVKVFAGGYSFGAEAVPATLAAVPRSGALSRIAGLVLLAPGPYATFEVSPLDWIEGGDGPTDFPVAASLARLGGLPILCLDGAEDRNSGCHGSGATGVLHEEIPGGHHFGGAFKKVAQRIEAFIRRDGASGR